MLTIPAGFPQCLSVIVERNLFVRAGPILRVLNTNVPGTPAEVYAQRFPFLHDDSIPQFLYVNRLTIKAEAIAAIVASFRDNGNNLAEHPKITHGDWSCRFTVGSTHPDHQALFKHEPGPWVFHFPHLTKMVRGKTYSDGSCEAFHVINLTCNLVQPHQRAHVPEGGWNYTGRSDTGPAEKRQRTGYPNRNTNLMQAAEMGAAFATNATKTELDHMKKELAETQRALEAQKAQLIHAPAPPLIHSTAAYPDLPSNRIQHGGHTPYMLPERGSQYIVD